MNVENCEPLHEPDWPYLDLDDILMSNFDHEVNQVVAQRLRDENVVAGYTAWNFYAHCWFADGQYHAAVKVCQVYRAVLSADTPEQLMEDVSDEFGHE